MITDDRSHLPYSIYTHRMQTVGIAVSLRITHPPPLTARSFVIYVSWLCWRAAVLIVLCVVWLMRRP